MQVNDSRLHRIGRVETELEIFPADSFRLEFDLEYDWRFTDLNLQKLFVRYDFENSNIRLGFMKKMFSLEEINSRSDRLLIRKSMLNNILEDFFLFGRDFTVQYRHNFPSYTLIGSFAGDGSARVFTNLTLRTRNLDKKRIVAAFMYKIYEDKDATHNRQNAFFANVGLELDGRINDFELETIWGKNLEKYGVITMNYIEFKERNNIGFLGIRFQQSFPVTTDRKHLKKIVPLYETVYFSDSFAFKNAYWQIRPGVNLSFARRDRLQWRTNLDLIMTANNQESRRPQIISQRVLSEIFVHW